MIAMGTAANHRHDAESYGASPTRRSRRSKLDIENLRSGLYTIVSRQKPMTCRQVFYQAVGAGLIDKTEQEYKGTVCRLLADMRRERVIPYGWIADNTRWMRKPITHSSMDDALDQMQSDYRRNLWDNQESYVEVWLEKDALSGVLYNVTSRWDVPLMVTRGYPSLSFLHGAAEAIAAAERPVYLYYFGDHDPSGQDISRVVERALRELAPDADINFERVAVNRWQIAEYNLPTRPTKKTDSRSRSFEGESVEVDAIPPGELRRLCEDSITKHVDRWQYEQLQRIEQAERDTLAAVTASFRLRDDSDEVSE